MNRKEFIGGAVALKGAGIVGTFTFLDGIRLLDGLVPTILIWSFICLGVLLMVVGLAMLSKAETEP